jgi:hypothetical protein
MILATTLAVFLAGCRGKSAPTTTALDAAIVPNADFLLRCDVKATRETPIGKKVQQTREENEKTDPALKAKSDLRARIKQDTGFTREDIDAILMTAALANTDLKGADGSSVINRLPVVLAISISKPMSVDQLRAAVKIMSEDRPGVSIDNVKIDSTTAVMVKPADSNQPAAYAATSIDGKTVYVTLSEQNLRDTLIRSRQNQPASLSSALTAAERKLLAASQLKAVFIAPNAVRQAIKERIAAAQKKGGGAGMFMNFAKPFENIQSASLLAHLATDATFILNLELGSVQDAAQVAMIVPLVQGLVPAGTANGYPDLNKALSVTNVDSSVSVTLRLTEEDLTRKRTPPPRPANIPTGR